MLRFILLLGATIFFISVFSQHVYQLKGDSIQMNNNRNSAELILENSTKMIAGFLYNKGNGRTEFRKALLKINDSLYLIGSDTLRLINQPGNYIQNQYAVKQTATAWISGRFKTGGLLSADSALSLKANATDYAGASNGWIQYNSAISQFRGYRNGAWNTFSMAGDAIANSTTQQANTNFNISGNGTIGGTVNALVYTTYISGLTNKTSFYASSSGSSPIIIAKSNYATLGHLQVLFNNRYNATISPTLALATFDFNGDSIIWSGSNSTAIATGININVTSIQDPSARIQGTFGNTGININSITTQQTAFYHGYYAGSYSYGAKITAINKDTGYWNSGSIGLWLRAANRKSTVPAYAIYADSGNVFIREKLITQGAQEVKRTVASSTMTLNETHYYLAGNATTASFTLNLPDASLCNGRIYIIKKIDASTNTISIFPYSSQSIDGQNSYTLQNQWQIVRIVSNGSGWEII